MATPFEIKMAKTFQCLLNALCIVITFILYVKKVSYIVKWVLFSTNLAIAVFIAFISVRFIEVPLLYGRCYMPIWELIGLANEIVVCLCEALSTGRFYNFDIPSFCYGFTVATFVAQVQDILGFLGQGIMVPTGENGMGGDTAPPATVDSQVPAADPQGTAPAADSSVPTLAADAADVPAPADTQDTVAVVAVDDDDEEEEIFYDSRTDEFEVESEVTIVVTNPLAVSVGPAVVVANVEAAPHHRRARRILGQAPVVAQGRRPRRWFC